MYNNISSVANECCGCKSCEQICPNDSISFSVNAEGFWYPVVDVKKCISCGRCVKHCPIVEIPQAGTLQIVYAAKCRDKTVVCESSSGGIFFPLAKEILNRKGIVFGCAYDDKLVARHIAVEEEKELYRLQGSKYVQSDLSGSYKQIKNELKKGRWVLFCGTGCQIAGLRSFLGKNYETLFLIDIVCHGVPSPKLFSKYIAYLENSLGEPVRRYDFRSKKHRGWGHFFEVETDTRKKSGCGFDDPYYNAFLNGKTYRESCYGCHFATQGRMGDITLADFWGIEYLIPSFYSKDGISLVILNTEKGKRIWKLLENEIDFIESDMECAIQMNRNLSKPSERPACRDTIYDGIDGNIENYIKEKLFVKNDIKRKFKSLFPVALKGYIKYIMRKK